MKQIGSVMKDIFLLGDDTPTPKASILNKWLVWVFGVFVLLNIMFADEVLRTIAGGLVCGILLSLWAFHDKNYVETKLKVNHKNLLASLYRLNLILMVIGEGLQVFNHWGDTLLSFFARESFFLVFWFLSIPLVLIHNLWKWCIWTGSVFFISIGYHILLRWYINNWNTITFSFLCLAIGTLLIAAAASLKISHDKIRKLFN